MGSCWQVLTSIWDDLEWEYVKCSSFFILNPWTVGIQIDSYFLGLLCVTSVFPIQPWIVYIQVSFSLLCTVSSSKVDFFWFGMNTPKKQTAIERIPDVTFPLFWAGWMTAIYPPNDIFEYLLFFAYSSWKEHVGNMSKRFLTGLRRKFL